jgi:hypothetical protein
VRNPFKKIAKYLAHPNLAAGILFEKLFARSAMPDARYLEIEFRLRTGHRLNLKNPQTFSEKIQWLKLYDRRDAYTRMVDKYAVRSYITEKIGGEFLFPLLGVWDKFDGIDFESLPEQFVLKCNHDSGGLVICTDKSRFDTCAAKKLFTRHLKINYYYGGKQWAYKNIVPKIIAEKYMTDESGTELKDYKFFCFNGEPKIIQVDFNRYTGHKRNFYTPEWDYAPVTLLYKTYPNIQIPKPPCLGVMHEIAKTLSAGIPFVRVDLYAINGKVYFGELTFYPGSGYEKFLTPEWDGIFGDWLALPAGGAPR